MALILIKEDGTGMGDANSYATGAEGDAYHAGHLYADAWLAAAAGRKEAALVMATRVIDVQYQFYGFKANEGQALQWPRYKCPDRDRERLWQGEVFLSSGRVPAAIVGATCEMARELLIVDRTAAPPGEGVSQLQGSDLARTVYSKQDTRPIVSHLTQAMLTKYGELMYEGSGAAKLERV